MPRAVESGFIAPSPTLAPRPLRALPIEEVESPPLIARLAADRLRDLRDDGLTLAYVAKMYGVEPGEMEALEGELIPSRTR